ncbi:MAG: bifunctional hydroxymethylpyrimidine kinase/phosphomethylpyrimidine kinase [Ruminococcus sp.]|jgi:hydroxymethylpyrimidine/phosphomethylpyrimidine kinase
MKTVLTIAGSDSSGGAGIQADIKTITAHGLYASSAITALTAQNTTGVYGIMEVTPKFLASQLDCVFKDIFPDAVKIGMVSSAPLIEVIAQKLERYRAKHIVVDPVMVSTSGSRLLADDAADTLMEKLIPMAEIITPNIPEGEVLCGFSIEDSGDMERAAEKIAENVGTAVLLKGGHEQNDANDVLFDQGSCRWFMGERIDNPNTHGTGCTLSSAIACGLARGLSLEDSVKEAKKYISGALRAGLDLGKGSGPLNHMFLLEERIN